MFLRDLGQFCQLWEEYAEGLRHIQKFSSGNCERRTSSNYKGEDRIDSQEFSGTEISVEHGKVTWLNGNSPNPSYYLRDYKVLQ